ncbi:MAG: nitrilase-related carbon-nitrogen hydrolase [Actinomycetes bacterium]
MIRIAVGQVALDVDDPVGTWQAVTGAVERAAGADLVVLPELTATGGGFTDAAEATARAEPVTGPTVTALRELSARHRCALVAGFAETSGKDRPYNSAVPIDRGALLACYRKTHLWDREKVLFTPGTQAPPVVESSVGRVGMVVCYDLEFPEVARRLARQGAQIITAPANWPLLPKPAGERPIETAKAQAAAAQNKVFIAIADRCGTDRGQRWTGGSVICDVSGYPLAEARIGRPDVVWAAVDPALADDKRLGPHNDAFGDLRPELYELLVPRGTTPFNPQNASPRE